MSCTGRPRSKPPSSSNSRRDPMTTPARDQLARYRRDPVAFCREVLGFEPWSKQREILESVRDYTRTAVRSCHGPGKTAVAARCALWFLSVFEHSKVITTAPTFHQVRELLWAEIHVAYRDAGGFVGGQLSDTRLELAPDWVALGLSTDQPERFQGHHAEHLLLVVDEASGVAEEIYEAAAGFLTSPGARCLLIGNPTRTSGEFFNAFHSARGFYNTIAIPASSTPAFTGEPVPAHVARRLVSTQWVEEHRRKWGAGSLLYQVRIAAEFPEPRRRRRRRPPRPRRPTSAHARAGRITRPRLRRRPLRLRPHRPRRPPRQRRADRAQLRRQRPDAHRRRDHPPRPRPRSNTRIQADDRRRRRRRRRRRHRAPARAPAPGRPPRLQDRRLQRRPRRRAPERLPQPPIRGLVHARRAASAARPRPRPRTREI